MSSWFQPVWDRLTDGYPNARSMASSCIAEVEKAYGGKKRHYHNAHHILALLAYAQEYRHQLKAPLLVDFAIVYHDIVYNVLRKDNEGKSALLAAKRLSELGMHPYEAGLVKLYIEATQHHQIPEGLDHAEDLAFFLDFDMAILGATWEDYQAYIMAVRKEYNIYPDMLYRPGRKKFLEQTLAAREIFHTQEFKLRFDAAARNNMEKELQYLCGK
jgi:predicted metal-dependent HD superfamily phosphohydrolase